MKNKNNVTLKSKILLIWDFNNPCYVSLFIYRIYIFIIEVPGFCSTDLIFDTIINTPITYTQYTALILR